MSAQDDVFAELKSNALRKIVGLYRRAWSHQPPDLASWIRAEPNRSASVAAALVRADAEERSDRRLPRHRGLYEAALGTLAHAAEVTRVLDALGAERAPEGSTSGDGGGHDSIVRAGTKFRDFLLIQHLGKGSFGQVWHARDLALDCDVALKLMVGSPERARRLESLRREASAASGIHHPHVVNVRGAGEIPEADLVYIAMELCADLDAEAVGDHRVRIGMPLDRLRESMIDSDTWDTRVAAELLVGICHGSTRRIGTGLCIATSSPRTCS